MSRTGVPSGGGRSIIASAMRAQAVLVGIVTGVTSIDLHGWRAALAVDRVLAGDVRLGDTVTIAWEELSSARQVQFADGQRVLVVLDTLPTQSLWRKRFPATERTGSVFVVASQGDAFLVAPDGVTLDSLEHFLAMTSEARDGAPGGARLAELVRGAHPAVAAEALAMLEAKPDDAAGLDAESAPALLAAARSSERDAALRGGALRLAARRRLPGTMETARALAEPGSTVRPEAYRALATLSNGLPPAEAERLIGDADPALRAVGVELLPADAAPARIAALVRDDPAAAVRLAAGRSLLTRQGSAAIPTVIGLLDDADANVRTTMAAAIGAVGKDAVAPLRAVVDGGSDRAAYAAVLGLARAGREGAREIKAIADHHDRPSVQAFAKLALGEAPASDKH